jgi:hypothetical protein
MNAYKVEAIVEAGGNLNLSGLPFHAGKAVEVIILERPAPKQEQSQSESHLYPLHGTVLSYDDPFGSAAPLESWDALQ